MLAQLIEFKTPDNLFLPGLLFAPAKKTRKAAIYLHGNGSSAVFYKVAYTNTFAEALTRRGIAYFAFNNRGAHYMQKLHALKRSRHAYRLYGMVYERIRECVSDIDGAIAYLRAQGFREFYLIGSSTGANKICVYNWHKPKNRVAKYVLLGGGDDTGIYYTALGKKKFFAALTEAQQKIARGKGTELVPKHFSFGFISWQSLYDTINPDGDYNVFPFNEVLRKLKLSKKKLFRKFAAIKKPTLVVYGSDDEYCYGKVPQVVELLKKHCGAPEKFSFNIIPDAGHGFGGKEKTLARMVATWLMR